jgi:uncharacterized membrane protein YvlD (DUF360 family)
MKSYLIRLVLIACAFYYAFPMLHGIVFHGNFIHALVVGAVFAFIGWALESVAIAITAIMAITTLGLALVILVPAWILGFWLLPAIALKLVADFMPSSLTITGWLPAIWGGLIMLVIGIVTSSNVHKKFMRSSTA